MRDMLLKDKVVIVTGAASGIGAAVAHRYASSGARVAVVDINKVGAEKVRKNLVNNESHRTFYCDLAEPSQCSAVVADVLEWAGRVDVLVNSAAYLERKQIDDVDVDFMNRTVAINMTGPFFLARACAKIMKSQGWGRIILFSSQGAYTGGYNGSAVYAMTKAGIIALVKSLAREYAADGITVNSVAPAGANTQMLHGGMSPEDVADFIDKIPMGRLAQPEEIAEACEFLASDRAGYITGHTLDVNGGMLMR
ncbi:MAG: short-chain dehydrogenase [Alphaproteobacteria bacterium]|nr:MAG: short-chain dehydrogenase [Alphaproteobacteria bacterium]